MSRPGQGAGNGLKQPKEEVSIKYMHRPPRIAPNYGPQRRSLLPKSKLSRVLLYDNATQDHMLDIKLAHIKIEKDRISRIINLHKKSFSTRMSKKQAHMQALLNSSSNGKTGLHSNDHRNSIDSAKDRPLSLQTGNKDGLSPRDAMTARSMTVSDIKFPALDDDKRHVIFKVKNAHGKTEVYHTVDDEGVLADIIPTSYRKMTDDPRFTSLQRALVPPDSLR